MNGNCRMHIGHRLHRTSVRCLYLILAIVVLAALPRYASAQLDVATIQGRVTDQSGALVPNAKVTASGVETSTNRVTTTNSDGVYSFPSLKPGKYVISIEASGFSKVKLTISTGVGQIANGDATLAVGSTTAEVTVNASSMTDVQTESHEVSTSISEEAITDLPTSGRNILSVTTLGAGSQAATDTIESVTSLGWYGASGRAVSLAGAQTFQTGFLQDGNENVARLAAAANIVSSAESTAEVKTVVNGSDARYRDPAIVNVISKQGLRSFHGAAYEFLQNDVFNAAPYNVSGTSQKKAPERYDLFGGAVGGPIIPHKLFFFFDYSGLRNGTSYVALARVPTTNELNGDFSDYTQLIYDPASYDPVTETTKSYLSETGKNAIPSTVTPNPIFKQYLSLFPAPNIPLNANNQNYQATLGNTTNSNQYLGRVDWDISDRHKIYGAIQDNNSPTNQPSIVAGQFGNTYLYSGMNAFVEDTYVFNSRMVNTARAGYNRSITGESEFGVGVKDWATEFGLQGLDAAPSQWAIPNLGIWGLGIPASNPYAPQVATQNRFQYGDEINWTLGKHSIFFGGEFIRTQFDGNWAVNNTGIFSFTGAFTAKYTAGPSGPVESANPLEEGIGIADFYLGYTSAATASTGPSLGAFRESELAAYVQDDWKMLRNLTLNLGVRYQFDNPPNDKHGNSSIYDVPTNAIVPGTWLTNYKDWAPRIGASYSPLPGLAIHGGYGIYYTNNAYNYLQMLFTHPPAFVQQSNPYYITNPTPIQTSLSLHPSAAGQAPFTLARKEPDPWNQQWNVSIEKSFASNYLASVGYVGNIGRNQSVRVDENQANAITPGSTSGRYDQHPYSWVGDVFEQDPVAWSNYQGLLTSIKRSFHNGSQFLAAYTWSKNMDISEGDGVMMENKYNLRADWAPSAYDRTHQLTFSGVYQIPVGRGRRFLGTINPIANEIIGGWEASGIFKFATGLPVWVNATNFADTNPWAQFLANKTAACNPNHFAHTKAQWYDTSCFTQPDHYQYGIGGRNSARGPGIDQVDFSVHKSFPIFNEHQLEFRSEWFNILNHPQYTVPGVTGMGQNTQGVYTYAAVNGALGMRVAQFALRYSF